MKAAALVLAVLVVGVAIAAPASADHRKCHQYEPTGDELERRYCEWVDRYLDEPAGAASAAVVPGGFLA